MINHHPRPSPAHNDADTLSHFIIVAVDGTFAASGLVGADAAVVEAVEGVVEQFAAGRAQCVVAFFAAAVEPDHQFDHGFLLTYSVTHIKPLIWWYKLL